MNHYTRLKTRSWRRPGADAVASIICMSMLSCRNRVCKQSPSWQASADQAMDRHAPHVCSCCKTPNRGAGNRANAFSLACTGRRPAAIEKSVSGTLRVPLGAAHGVCRIHWIAIVINPLSLNCLAEWRSRPRPACRAGERVFLASKTYVGRSTAPAGLSGR